MNTKVKALLVTTALVLCIVAVAGLASAHLTSPVSYLYKGASVIYISSITGHQDGSYAQITCPITDSSVQIQGNYPSSSAGTTIRTYCYGSSSTYAEIYQYVRATSGGSWNNQVMARTLPTSAQWIVSSGAPVAFNGVSTTVRSASGAITANIDCICP